MKRFIILAVMLLSLSANLYADDAADRLVKEVLSKIESYNPYRAEIDVNYAGSSILGFYEVDKAKYYIAIDNQELYGDSSVKYEIFNSRKEVVIDSVTPDFNGNILSNPATAFSSIRDHFSAMILSKDEAYSIIELKPIKGDSDNIESIEMRVSHATMLPEEVIYKFGDEMVSIKVLKLQRLTSSITSYSVEKYSDYEVIDFR